MILQSIHFNMYSSKLINMMWCWLFIYIYFYTHTHNWSIAQLAEVVEYTDCISAEG